MGFKIIVAGLSALTLAGLAAGPSSVAETAAHSQSSRAAGPPAGSSEVTPAQARTFINMGSRDGAGIHACASNTCAVSGWATIGDALYDYCYVTGQALEGNPWWDLVQNVRTGAIGYTNENWLWDPTQTQAC